MLGTLLDEILTYCFLNSLFAICARQTFGDLRGPSGTIGQPSGTFGELAEPSGNQPQPSGNLVGRAFATHIPTFRLVGAGGHSTGYNKGKCLFQACPAFPGKL